MRRLVIIGASGHGRVAADVARRRGYREIVFLDDNRELRNCGKYPVIGTAADFRRLVDEMRIPSEFFVAVGNAGIREALQKKLEYAGGTPVTLVHPDAVIGDEVRIGAGSVMMAGAVINPGTVIGGGCIINTSSSVDHDCMLGDYVHIAVGAHVAGNVVIGNAAWIGAGATISNNLRICDRCVIGAGAVVVSDIRKRGKYVGIPAKIMSRDCPEFR
ncbi:acetyltransferase [Otoolea muris]|uniref:acetyltransferase n=1 Tax=Otoolea muris TaxID=2941515 RepID=UPI00203B7D7B|nr:acetyltransferase [Otoolea muris]